MSFCKTKLAIPRDFPGSPAIKTLSFQWEDPGSIPGWGSKIHMLLRVANKKKKKGGGKNSGEFPG